MKEVQDKNCKYDTKINSKNTKLLFLDNYDKTQIHSTEMSIHIELSKFDCPHFISFNKLLPVITLGFYSYKVRNKFITSSLVDILFKFFNINLRLSFKRDI